MNTYTITSTTTTTQTIGINGTTHNARPVHRAHHIVIIECSDGRKFNATMNQLRSLLTNKNVTSDIAIADLQGLSPKYKRMIKA